MHIGYKKYVFVTIDTKRAIAVPLFIIHNLVLQKKKISPTYTKIVWYFISRIYLRVCCETTIITEANTNIKKASLNLRIFLNPWMCVCVCVHMQ